MSGDTANATVKADAIFPKRDTVPIWFLWLIYVFVDFIFKMFTNFTYGAILPFEE